MDVAKVQRTDQWLTSGECSKCRRQSYCGKDCKPHKRMAKEADAQAMAHIFERILMGSIKRDKGE